MRQGQRITTMTSGQARFPVAPSMFKFAQHGQSGAWVSDLLPLHGEDRRRHRDRPKRAHQRDQPRSGVHVRDDGQRNSRARRASARGSPTGSAARTTICRRSSCSRRSCRRKRGAGAVHAHVEQRLPAHAHNGVALRAQGDPGAVPREPRRRRCARPAARCSMRCRKLNQHGARASGDPETQTRIAQYEMAFRMQTSVPELTDFSGNRRRRSICTGPTVKEPGTFAASCLLARRLAERNVRVVQILHRGWDQHGTSAGRISHPVQGHRSGLLRR